jgi:hypothetical protein
MANQVARGLGSTGIECHATVRGDRYATNGKANVKQRCVNVPFRYPRGSMAVNDGFGHLTGLVI